MTATKSISGKRKLLTVLFVLNLLFILGNSLLNGPQSRVLSDRFTDLIEFLIGRDITVGNIAGGDGTNFVVRKAAHAIEYLSLGFIGSMLVMYGRPSAPSLKTVALIGISVPVLDEGIQSFTGRTSSVRDVWLDIAGFAIGVALSVLIQWIYLNRRKSSHKVKTGRLR